MVCLMKFMTLIRRAVRSLANDRSIVIKKADKGSCIVVWDREDYLLEAERQLGDTSIYKDVSFNDKVLSDLVDNSNKLFQCLKRKGSITDKELKYFYTIIKILLIWVNCTSCLKSINVCLMCQVDQLSLIVGHRLKRHQSF